ncbi:MAG: hypothetical protein K9J12_04115 [Melioribacteraceae bacterium]|nr:hypothetical protein [Melioribacteraceae bacterium]MCF8263264.1 hypothetical protein [Melioribacteraceae bacterium]MCF8412865.1 hypothetical protein [Melioribacteraceae bacterium]MCF8430704.1 hypothetical protein [Melioribacteraceae bacterium]
MPLFQSHAGFNLTNAKLQLVEVSYREDGFHLENVDEEYFKEYWNTSSKETQILNILQNAYDEITLRNPVTTQNISFTLPNETFKLIEIPTEKALLKDDLTAHLKWELSVLYPTIEKEEFVIQKVGAVESENSVTITVLTALKKYLRLMHNFSVRNNLVLKFVDNAHIASLVTPSFNYPQAKTVVQLYMGENSISVSFCENNQIRLLKIIKTGDTIDLEEKLVNIIDEMSNSFVSVKNIDLFILTGDPFPRQLIPKIEIKYGITFRKLKPFENLKVDSKLRESEFYLTKSNSFSAAAGIAYRLI